MAITRSKTVGRTDSLSTSTRQPLCSRFLIGTWVRGWALTKSYDDCAECRRPMRAEVSSICVEAVNGDLPSCVVFCTAKPTVVRTISTLAATGYQWTLIRLLTVRPGKPP